MTISQSGQSCDFELCDEQSGQQCLWLVVSRFAGIFVALLFNDLTSVRVMVGGAGLLQNFLAWSLPGLDDSLV